MDESPIKILGRTLRRIQLYIYKHKGTHVTVLIHKGVD